MCSVQSGSNSANKRDTMKMTWDDDLQLHIDYVYGGGVWCSVLTECQWGKKEWNWSVPLAKGYNQLCLCFHVSMPIIMHEFMMQSVYSDALFLRVGVGCSYMNLFCSYVCMYVCVCCKQNGVEQYAWIALRMIATLNIGSLNDWLIDWLTLDQQFHIVIRYHYFHT